MYPIVFQLGPITVYSFGVMMAIAFLTSGYVLGKELERKGLDPNLSGSLVFWAAIGGLSGARLWIILDDLEGFLNAPVSFLLTGAGFVWYGGLVGGLIAVSWFIHRQKLPWLVTSDCVGTVMPLGHAIGRIGCQLAGDGDWGKVTTLPWAMAYPNAIIGWDYLPGVRVHPAPLYEAILYIGIFLLIWGLRARLSVPGSTLALYFVLAAIARFFVEFIRIEPVVQWNLTQAQLFSIVVGLAGAWMLIRASRGSAAPQAHGRSRKGAG